eukprot:scpid49384/ scgid8613/ 
MHASADGSFGASGKCNELLPNYQFHPLIGSLSLCKQTQQPSLPLSCHSRERRGNIYMHSIPRPLPSTQKSFPLSSFVPAGGCAHNTLRHQLPTLEVEDGQAVSRSERHRSSDTFDASAPDLKGSVQSRETRNIGNYIQFLPA